MIEAIFLGVLSAVFIIPVVCLAMASVLLGISNLIESVISYSKSGEDNEQPHSKNEM